MIFGQRLKQLRNQYKLTQQEMSDRLCMDQSTYSRYENCISKATTDIILRVAEEFNVPVEWLLTEDPDANKRPH